MSSQARKELPRSLYPLLISALALSACVSTTPPATTGHASKEPSSAHSSSHYSQATPASRATVAALYTQLNEWRGTPYLLGGNNKRGIDCSGFVKQTFAQRFQHTVPRTTKLLAKEGQQIRQSSLEAGDLVFFKTGRGVRHVGIYISEGNFVHASKSAGVTLSNLDSNYWKSHYWQSRRLPRP